MNTLYPVLLSVPKEKRQLSGKEKVIFLSRYARVALQCSAMQSRVRIGDLNKDSDGVPLPTNGYFWSLTHKPLYVGGVVSPHPVGLDIEEIKPCSQGLFKKVAHQEEWNLDDADPYDLFFRFWTSKEAVIKTEGTGIRDLLRCRVVEILDPKNLLIRFQEKIRHIEHYYFHNHIASIVKDQYKIDWRVLQESSLPQSLRNFHY